MNNFSNTQELENTLKYFKHIGEKKSKFIVNQIGAQVIEYDEVNEERRTHYMKQLKKANYAFIHLYKKCAF